MSNRAALVLALATLHLCALGCGGQRPNPTSASTDTQVTVVFHVYNSATGPISGADFARAAHRNAGTRSLAPLSIALDELRTTGVDRRRAVLRTAHSGDRIGSLIAMTDDGVLTFQPAGDTTYELFLMNTTSGADYGCLDYSAEPVQGSNSAFTELRRTTTGTLLGCTVQDGPDEPFQTAVEQFNRALNPFGIRYGYIDYRGTDVTLAGMTAGWTSKDGCRTSVGAHGMLIVQLMPSAPAVWPPVWVSHELAHAYLGAPDYYENARCFSGNLTCALFDCSNIQPTFSAAGGDAARYWALTDRRERRAP